MIRSRGFVLVRWACLTEHTRPTPFFLCLNIYEHPLPLNSTSEHFTNTLFFLDFTPRQNKTDTERSNKDRQLKD
jgi:hypothetical protein